MRCKNCNLELHAAHIGRWCLDCIGKLVARENAARAEGWQGAWAAWDRVIGTTGEATPLIDGIRAAFRAGFAARGLPDPSRHGLPDVMRGAGSYQDCGTKGEGVVGMCPRCGARIKPKDDGSGDFEGCAKCGFGLKEDRITPWPYFRGLVYDPSSPDPGGVYQGPTLAERRQHASEIVRCCRCGWASNRNGSDLYWHKPTDTFACVDAQGCQTRQSLIGNLQP